MNALATAISGALIHFVWQGAIVGLVLWVTLFVLKKRSADSRYAAACAALALMAVLPVVTAWRLYGRSVAPNAGPVLSQSFSQIFSAAAPAGIHSLQAVLLAWLQSWALPVWSIGVVLFSARLVVGYGHALRLRRRGDPSGEAVLGVVRRLAKAMRVRRPIRVLMSSLTDTPSVVGWLRPVILLPAAALIGLSPLQLEAILAHEIGHIKRYDYLVNMLQMLAETLLFYHPAVWWASRQIRVERELCCDDLAVQFSGNALRYARALTRLEKLRLTTPGVAMASTGGPLLFRIQRLAGIDTNKCGPARLPVVMAIALGLVCMALNVGWMRAQDAPGVRVDLGAGAVIHRTPVPYPDPAQRKGITGTVQLEVTLDSDGNAADAHVLSGPQELRKASLESVLNWHFTADAARSTRLVSISFSEQGKQVQVSEPEAGKSFFQFLGKSVVVMPDAQEPQTLEAAQARLAQRQQMESEIKQTRSQIEQANRNGEPEAAAALAAKVQSLQRQLEEIPLQGWAGNLLEQSRANSRRAELNGRSLKAINTGGLDESVRPDFLSRLPVRVGDTLSPQLIEQTTAAVRSFDEHLNAEFVGTGDGQAELRIIVRNEERR